MRAANDPAVRTRLESQGNVLTLSPVAFYEKVKKETRELADVVEGEYQGRVTLCADPFVKDRGLIIADPAASTSLILPRQAGFAQF